jgi:hypothetical protein
MASAGINMVVSRASGSDCATKRGASYQPASILRLAGLAGTLTGGAE